MAVKERSSLAGPAGTEDAPARGRVTAFGVLVSEAEHWMEDGVHVLRSTEFDLTAGDPDFERAVQTFGEKAEDLFWYLADLDTITGLENDTFLILAPRINAIQKELERRETERRRRIISISLARFRNRGDHFRDWQPLSTPGNFSQPLHA